MTITICGPDGAGAGQPRHRPRPRRRAGLMSWSMRLLAARSPRPGSVLRSPGGQHPVPLPVTRGGQRPVARLPVPGRRHRDQHPVQDRDDVGADDLRAAGLPGTRTPGSALAALAVARPPDRAARPGLRPAGRPAAPAVHQDAHAAGRNPPRPARHLPRHRPPSPRHGRVALPPGRQHRPRAGPAADRPARAGRAATAASAAARLAARLDRQR
jgi:hypothetical protein